MSYKWSSGEKGGKPSGEKAEIKKSDTQGKQEDIQKENESAEILANEGYQVEQNPVPKANGKEPDYKIEGEYFDCYAPQRDTPSKIRKGISKKVNSGQTERIVLNLDRSPVTSSEMSTYLKNNPKEGLNEVIGVKNGKITQIYP